VQRGAAYESRTTLRAPGDSVDAYLRPLRGDHVHLAFAVYVRGELVRSLSDRPLVGLTSEGRHVENLFPHFGVHTGGPGFYDNSVVHVHPGTSWIWFTGTEGLGCTLGAFLEQLGITLWAPDGLKYPYHVPVPSMPLDATCLDSAQLLVTEADGAAVASTASWTPEQYAVNHTILCEDGEYVWRAYLWRSIDDAGRPPAAVLNGSLDRLWLPYADAMLSLSYERRAEPPGGEGRQYTAPAGDAAAGAGGTTPYPYPRASTIAAIRAATPDSFDGGLYPRSPDALPVQRNTGGG
jgi:hypothetical protein